MTRPTIELSEFPIVRITFHMDTSLEDIAAHREAFLQLFAKRGPVLTIADINMVRRSSATPIHRKAIAETADALAKRGGFIAEFIVVRSTFLRRLVTAYSWISGQQDTSTALFRERRRGAGGCSRAVAATRSEPVGAAKRNWAGHRIHVAREVATPPLRATA